MNDWKFSQFIKVIIIIQFLVLITTGLSFKGINIPIITQLIGFIYLTFIPGYLILRILKIHQIGSIKSLLYATGLSTVSIMFIGFIINLIAHFINIDNPISLVPLITVITLFVIILSALSYLRDKDFSSPCEIDMNMLSSPIVLFLYLVPFLAIFGSYVMNFYNSNLISMILFLLLAFIIILIVFNKIPENINPFVIWIISISILYVSSLISTYIWGWDIQNEYFLANMTYNNSFWNFNFPDAYNAMLSVVIIAPVYSIFTNMDLTQVFKIIYPFLFSLVPLGLYKVFKSQTNSKISLLACFLFVSFYTFFIEMLALAREMIAEMFLILILLVIFTDKINNRSRILFIIFGLGLVVSHYSLTYFSLFALISTFMLILVYYLYKWFINTNGESAFIYLNKIINSRINIFILLLITAFMYFWYGNIAQGKALLGLTDALTLIIVDVQKITILTSKIGLNDIYSLILGFLLTIFIIIILLFKYRKNIANRGSIRSNFIHLINPILQSKFKNHYLAVLSIVILIALVFFVGKPQTWIVGALRYLNFAVVFFTALGLIFSFMYLFKNKVTKEFYAISFLSFLVLLTGIFIPAFENSFNITRIFQMTFVFLSPFSIIGGFIVFKSILKVLKAKVMNDDPIKIFSIFLIFFMLFNAGFFSVLSNQSIPMHLSKESDYYPRFEVPETKAAEWLYNKTIGAPIYADSYGVFVFYKYFNPVSINSIYKYNEKISSYIFLRKLNQDNKLLFGFEKGARERSRLYKDMSEIINPKNRIYDSGDASIYFS